MNNIIKETKQKQNLYIDMDGVIINTIKAVCDYYNTYYKNISNYQFADHKKVWGWNFAPAINLTNDEVNKIFADERLFNFMELMINCKETLPLLKEKYNLKLYTIGNGENIINKIKFLKLQGVYGLFDELIFKDNKCNKMFKSDLCRDGILVDDNQDNLFSLPKTVRGICFGEVYDFNKDWKGENASSWNELLDMLL